MEKRVLLAIFLSFLVLFVYQSLFVKPRPAGPGSETAEDQTKTSPPQPAEAHAPPRFDPEPEVVAPLGRTLVGDTETRSIVVETPEVTAVFGNRGGVLRSWQLKRYLDSSGKPLELVPQDLPGAGPEPFVLRVNDAGVTSRLRTALYRASGQRVDATSGPAELVFEYQDEEGLKVEKRYLFDAKVRPYVVAVSATVEAGGQRLQPILEFGPGLASALQAGSGSSFYYRQSSQGIFFREGDVSRLDVSDLAETPAYEGRFGFVGMDDHYFLAAAIPGSVDARVEYRTLAAPLPPGATGDTPRLVAFTLRPSAPLDGIPFYLGPKEFDVLATIDHDLTRAIHFGFFAIIIVPLLQSLKWVHGYVGNYGWAIIILTILINAAMFPLRHKSVVSMRKMQEIQPEIKAIQERYAKLKISDPARQKMNTEMMNLYRERGVNPASGCLPMLLTMPVLFAFYSLLSVAIEIRGAPFILWIKDLSMHDPLYVTPILMGGTMVMQQKMTPSTADPMQQRMMMMMPIVFTFMFLWAPSGLVLYWFVSNLWAIAQQVVTNRIIGPPPVHAVRPPAERRVKRAPAPRATADQQ